MVWVYGVDRFGGHPALHHTIHCRKYLELTYYYCCTPLPHLIHTAAKICEQALCTEKSTNTFVKKPPTEYQMYKKSVGFFAYFLSNSRDLCIPVNCSNLMYFICVHLDRFVNHIITLESQVVRVGGLKLRKSTKKDNDLLIKHSFQ